MPKQAAQVDQANGNETGSAPAQKDHGTSGPKRHLCTALFASNYLPALVMGTLARRGRICVSII